MKILKVVLLFLFLYSLSLFADEIRPCYLQIKTIDKNNYDIIFKIPAKHKKLLKTLHVEFDEGIKKNNNIAAVLVDGSYIKYYQLQTDKPLQGTSLHIKGLSASSSEVLLRVIDEDANVISHSISPKNPHYTFVSELGTMQTIKTYTVLGIEHILDGTDHLLFVACLVMIAGTFSKLLWTITGFTFAHSITLFLSALDIVRVPIPPIEASIALSIVFLAMEIAKGDKNSLTYRHPGLVSSSFGLLHGFGFASALMEIGLPQQERVYALLFFNVGVEFGQIIFVLFILVVIWFMNLLWKNSSSLEWSKPVSYIIGTIAMMWLLERIMVF